MLKTIKRYILIVVVILGIVLFAVVVKAVSDFYRVNATTSSIINEQGSCRVVTNTSGVYDFFIPTKTLNEWNLFKTNKPASVTLSSCYQCPVTSGIYDNLTTCNNACIETASCTSQSNTIYGYVSPCYFGGDYCGDLGVCYGSCPGGSYLGGGINSVTCNTFGYNQIGRACFYTGEDALPSRYCYCSLTTTTYTCPLVGGSACSGSPQTCTKGTACTTLP